jgi:hypothetical protein
MQVRGRVFILKGIRDNEVSGSAGYLTRLSENLTLRHPISEALGWG